MNILALDSARWKDADRHGVNKKEIIEVVQKGVADARPSLPPLSDYLNILIYPDASVVIPETGDLGWNDDLDRIYLYFDPAIPYGKENLLMHLRATTFHELNHAARRCEIPFENTAAELMVSEGLASVFERNETRNNPPWARYEDDTTMRAWLEESLRLPDGYNEAYRFKHPDGRRWIFYRTGAWLIDTILTRQLASLKDLTLMPAEKVIDLLPR